MSEPLEFIRNLPAPHDIEVEQFLLGTLLAHNHAFDQVSSLINAGHFSDALALGRGHV